MLRKPRLKTRYSAHAVIVDDEGPSVLVTQAEGASYQGRYDLVGAVPVADETPAEALVRTLKQQTDTYLTSIERLGLLSSHSSYSDEAGQEQVLHHLAVLYEVTLKGALNMEHCLWLPVDLITSENSTAALIWAAEWVKSRPALLVSDELAEAV